MILSIVFIWLVPIVDFIVGKFLRTRYHVIYIHFGQMVFIMLANVYQYYPILINQFQLLNFLMIFGCISVSILVYLVDLIVKNMILNDILILDWKYYFRLTNKKQRSLWLSMLIACGEELIFRFPLLIFPEQWRIVFFSGFIAYGSAHLFFLRYDMWSKMALGALLGASVIWTQNIYVAIVIHGVYNFIVILFGGVECNNVMDEI